MHATIKLKKAAEPVMMDGVTDLATPSKKLSIYRVLAFACRACLFDPNDRFAS